MFQNVFHFIKKKMKKKKTETETKRKQTEEFKAEREILCEILKEKKIWSIKRHGETGLNCKNIDFERESEKRQENGRHGKRQM